MQNKDISRKDYDQKVGSEEKFVEYLSEGRIANFEVYHLVKNVKQKYCKIQPKIRWHVVPIELGRFLFALNFRKGLSQKVKQHINRMFVHYTRGKKYFKNKLYLIYLLIQS